MTSGMIKLSAVAVAFAALAAPVVANAASRVGEVNDRLHNQSLRIGQGDRSDELTWYEHLQVSERDARIRYQELRDEDRDGGHLTVGESRQLNHELNNDNRLIYRDKHNCVVR